MEPNKAKKAKGKARGPDVKADGETKEAASAVPVDKPNKEFKFWKTQPVAQFEQPLEGDNEPFEPNKPVSEIRQEPLELVSAFEWNDINIEEPGDLDELYNLLYENYVEDDDNMFRFDYSKAFLQWALKPPGWRREWHAGVRVKSNKKLVAFISAIPALIAVRGKEVQMVEINFLCVHKKLRDKRLAPLLIKEITRRVHLTGVFQAVYTAGTVLPRPVAKCRYWHRSLNPKKLVNVGFSHLSKRMTLARAMKLYKLPTAPLTPGLRPMEEKDVKQVTPMIKTYLGRFGLAPIFTEEEVAHWFLPREDVIATYVVENKETGKVTDLISFYSLPSTIIGHSTYKTLRAAYSYYNVSSQTLFKDLIQDALILANSQGYDVYNCLDLMDNESILQDLKFGPGDGNLHYYLFNWKCQTLAPKDVALVLM